METTIDICREVIWKVDDGIYLNDIKYITNTLGWKQQEKILKTVKIKWKYHTI